MIAELSAIVEQLAADAAVKGVVITSGKDTFCAGADLTMLEGLSRTFKDLRGGAGRGGGEYAAVRGKPQTVAALSPHRDLRQAVGRRDQRHGARRRFRTGAGLPSPHRRRQRRGRGSACPRSRSACFPAPAARSASRASCRRPMRCNFCSRATSSARSRQGAEAHRCRGAAGRSHQGGQGLDQQRAAPPKRRGTPTVSSCRAGRSIPRPA